MDLSFANTRSFLEYHRFHEHLNLTLKTSALSLIYTSEAIKKDNLKIKDIEELCLRKSLWGGMPAWGVKEKIKSEKSLESSETDPKDAKDATRSKWAQSRDRKRNKKRSAAENAIDSIESAMHNVGCWGVIQSFSAFDVFCETLNGELQSWKTKRLGLEKSENPKITNGLVRELAHSATDSAASKVEVNNKEDSVEAVEDADFAGRALRFYERYGWPTKSIDHLLPVYTYFTCLRNCVAHSKALASKALVNASKDAGWKKVETYWPKGETVPKPYAYQYQDAIKITHREAILASSMLRTLAYDMALRAIEDLGTAGFLHVIASKEIKRNMNLVGGKESTSNLHNHLNGVYRLKDLNHTETREILEHLGLWIEWNNWHEAVRNQQIKQKKSAKASRTEVRRNGVRRR